MLLYGAFEAPDADTLERMVVAGGGEVLRRGPPYEAELGRGGANLAVVGAKKGPADRWAATVTWQQLRGFRS